jgi:catechol 2,3-dioxygenase-like lactoylglutathione lyase family enzyme
MISLSGVHHVKLPVSDVERSRRWYQRTLGLTTDIEFVEDGVLQGVALAGSGSTSIALRHDAVRAAALSGFDALALAVPSRDDIPRWQARLDELDELDEPYGDIVTGHRGGSVLVGLHDPDGIEIRLYAD